MEPNLSHHRNLTRLVRQRKKNCLVHSVRSFPGTSYLLINPILKSIMKGRGQSSLVGLFALLVSETTSFQVVRYVRLLGTPYSTLRKNLPNALGSLAVSSSDVRCGTLPSCRPGKFTQLGSPALEPYWLTPPHPAHLGSPTSAHRKKKVLYRRIARPAHPMPTQV